MMNIDENKLNSESEGLKYESVNEADVMELKTLEETKDFAKKGIESFQVKISRLASLKTTRISKLNKLEQNIDQKAEELRQGKQKNEVSSKSLKEVRNSNFSEKLLFSYSLLLLLFSVSSST